MNKKRVFFVILLVLLLLLLAGLVYVYFSLGGDSQATADTDVGPGLKHVRTIYAYGEDADELLTKPYGIAYSQDRLYITLKSSGRVVVLDAEGNFIRTIGEQGRTPGQMMSPAGLDVDGAGSVYVADTSHAKVVVYGPDGEFQEEIPVERPLTPLVVDDTKLYVTALDSVNIFSLPGYQALSSWGRRGRGEAEFDFPNGIAVTDGGEKVYVSDGNNMRLKLLDENGEAVWVKGRPPESMNDQDRIFGLPAGMARKDEVLYIADPLNGVIHLYDTEGQKIGEVGENGSGNGQFSYPTHIAHIGGDRFAITEWGNDRVQIVEIDPDAVREAKERPEMAPGAGSSGN